MVTDANHVKLYNPTTNWSLRLTFSSTWQDVPQTKYRYKKIDLGKGRVKYLILNTNRADVVRVIITQDGYIRGKKSKYNSRFVGYAVLQHLGLSTYLPGKDITSYARKIGIRGKKTRKLFIEVVSGKYSPKGVAAILQLLQPETEEQTQYILQQTLQLPITRRTYQVPHTIIAKLKQPDGTFDFFMHRSLEYRVKVLQCRFVFDILRMIIEMGLSTSEIPRGTPHQVHEFLSTYQQRLETQDLKIPYLHHEQAFLASLNEQDTGWKFVFPATTHTLLEWGNKLYHCIGTYGQQAYTKRCLLLAAYRGDDLVYTLSLNLHVKQFVVEQFYGLYNASPNDVDNMTIRNAIKEANDKAFRPDHMLEIAT